MSQRRAGRTNVEWETPPHGNGFHWEHVSLEVLMDIRAELQRLNALLACQNFIGIPGTLKKIDRRLAAHAPLKKGKSSG